MTIKYSNNGSNILRLATSWKGGVHIAHHSAEIAFMFPPGKENWLFQYHLGVAYIQAYLKEHEITSKQVVPFVGSTLNDCVEQLIATNAKIIGFTCYDNNYFVVRAIAAFIKRKRPDIVVMVGGPTATFSDELILTNTPDIDLCVRFEGEETTLELASRIIEGTTLEDLDDISGIAFRRDNSIVRTPERELYGFNKKGSGLDGLPSPYLTGVLNGTEGTGVLSARGCTHHCSYCNYSAMVKHTIRYHSIDRIINELKYIQTALRSNSSASMAPRVIFIHDDTFSLNVRRAKNICERIINEGIKLQLSCNCRAENVDEELIELLSQAGFVELFFGLESAVPRILRNVKRIHSINPQLDKEDYASEKRFLSKVKEGVSLTKRYNMMAHVGVIMGLPGETLDDGLKTMEFVRDLGVDFYAHNYLALFPGTELFNTAINYGLRVKPSAFLLPYETQYTYPVYKIPFGKNSSLQLDRRAAAQAILRAFAGGPDTCTGSENGIVLALIESPDSNEFLSSFRWLSQFIAVGGKVFIIGKENDTIENYDLMQKANYNSGLPTRECLYLRRCSNKDFEIYYEIINKPVHGQLSGWDPQFPLIDFNKFVEFMKKRNSNEDQSWPVYRLNGKNDVYFLAALARVMARPTNKSIGARIWLDGVFLDGCRFSSGLCPALKMRRVFIDQEGEVLPCMTGQPLGTLNDDMKGLRNNAKKIFTEIREERKCEGCPADYRCSKCLFPYPLSPQEFCDFQRSNSGVAEIVVRSKVANTFNPFAIEDL